MALTESADKLKIGDTVPLFKLPNTRGALVSFDTFTKPKAFLVVFMCNHCPYVKAKLDELRRIYSDFKNKGLVVIGVNSNDIEQYPEDDLEHMQKLAEEGTIPYSYVLDETQHVAKAYGATCTPDPYLISADRTLVYHGRIDDPAGMGEVKNHDLYDAVKVFLADGTIVDKQYPSMGCNIKWKE